MKHAIVSIDGADYMAVFSNAVLVGLEEKGIDYTRLNESSTPMSDICAMMQLMIACGSRYAARKGLGEYPAISLEELRDLTDAGDLARFQAVIADLIIGDRQVDAAPPKKPAGGEETAPTN